MAQKIKPLRDLWFRFGSKLGLEWSEVASILARLGLIELIPNRSAPNFSHYRDTEELRTLTKTDPEEALNIIATEHFRLSNAPVLNRVAEKEES